MSYAVKWLEILSKKGEIVVIPQRVKSNRFLSFIFFEEKVKSEVF